MNESKMKMPLRMGALPDDIEQMRRIREERQSGRDLPLNMRSMPDDTRRDRDASRDLPLNMGSLPDDVGSPFVMRADRLLKMGVPVDLIRIVDEHLGDIPFNSEQELRAIDQILNMYSHLLENNDQSQVFEAVVDKTGPAMNPVGSGSASNEEFEKYKRAMGMERAD